MKKKSFLILALILLGLYLRAFNIPELLHFETDEATIAWKLRQLIVRQKPFLIGGSTPFGFHVGPMFYYLTAIPLWLAELDPIGWGIMAAIFSLPTLYLVYLVGKTLYSHRVGLIFLFLFATSFYQVFFDRHWWPLVLNPLFALLVLYSLYRKKYWITGLTLAFAWQADLSALVLFLPALVSFLRKRESRLPILLPITCSLLPLLLFELRHPGANLGKIFQASIAAKASFSLEQLTFIPRALSQLIIPNSITANVHNLYSWCSSIAVTRISTQPWWLVLFTAFLLLFTIYRYLKHRRRSDFLLSSLILSLIFGITLYQFLGHQAYDFYLATGFPLLLLSFALLINHFWKKFKLLSLAILVCFALIQFNQFTQAYYPQSYFVKKQAVSWTVDQLDGQPFALDSLSNCHRYNGLRYLFMLEDHEPEISFMDSSFFWLYDQIPATQNPDTLVIFATPKDLTSNQKSQYNTLLEKTISRKDFQELSVLILDNHGQTYTIDF
jgi:hypothetical protein